MSSISRENGSMLDDSRFEISQVDFVSRWKDQLQVAARGDPLESFPSRFSSGYCTHPFEP